MNYLELMQALTRTQAELYKVKSEQNTLQTYVHRECSILQGRIDELDIRVVEIANQVVSETDETHTEGFESGAV